VVSRLGVPAAAEHADLLDAGGAFPLFLQDGMDHIAVAGGAKLRGQHLVLAHAGADLDLVAFQGGSATSRAIQRDFSPITQEGASGTLQPVSGQMTSTQ